jgi:hypothetical protein
MSGYTLIVATSLPQSPLDAAAEFHAAIVPEVRAAQGDVVLAFDPADHSHKAWRLAAIQELAREAAPRRVNAVVGVAGPQQDEVLAFLAGAPGVTGQMLQADGNSAEMA